MTKKRKLCLSHWKSIFVKWHNLFPKLKFQVKLRTVWTETWILEEMNSFSALFLLFYLWTVLWTFADFPYFSTYGLSFELLQIFPVSLLYSPTHLIHGLSTSLFLSLCPPKICVICNRWLHFHLQLVGCLWWLQTYYFCFPGAIPIPACLSSLPHDFILSFLSTASARKANGDSELSLFFCPSLPWEIISNAVDSLQWKHRKESYFVIPSPQWQRLTVKLPASDKEGKECRAHIK